MLSLQINLQLDSPYLLDNVIISYALLWRHKNSTYTVVQWTWCINSLPFMSTQSSISNTKYVDNQSFSRDKHSWIHHNSSVWVWSEHGTCVLTGDCDVVRTEWWPLYTLGGSVGSFLHKLTINGPFYGARCACWCGIKLLNYMSAPPRHFLCFWS